MLKKSIRMPFGLRTLKTAIAIIAAMVAVDFYGATTSKLIFAMLGAMTAVQPTFKESLEASLAQIVGVLFGAIAGIGLLALPLPPLVLTGIGIILVITLYNAENSLFSIAALLYCGHALRDTGYRAHGICPWPDLGYRHRPFNRSSHQYADLPLRQQPSDPCDSGEFGP